MNKLFTKIATLSIGLAMAIGVGVAVGGKEARVARAATSYAYYQFTSKAWVSKLNTTGYSGSSGTTKNWTSTKEGGQLSSGQGVQITTTVSTSTVTCPDSYSDITSVVVTYCTNDKSGVGSINGYVGTTSGSPATFNITKPSSGGTTLKSATFTFSKATGAPKFTVTCTTNSVYIYGVTVTYGSGEDDYENDPNLTSPVTIGPTSSCAVALPTTSGSAHSSATPNRISGLAIRERNIYKSGSNYIMFVENKGFIYNVDSLGTINSVAITYSSGTSTSGKVGVYFGTSVLSDYTTTSNITIKGQSQTDTFTNTTVGNGFFQLSTSNKNVQVTSIVVTYGKTYTVTYYGNNNTGGSVPVDGTTYIDGATVTVKSNSGSLIRTGYSFGGWNTNSSGTGTNYVAGSGTFTISANQSLFAKWNASTYSISYSLDGGSHGTTHPTSGTYDTAFYVSAPTKTGYTFTGWTVTNGLDSGTAKWGTTSSPSTTISDISTKCVNGSAGNVYFKNINASSAAVTLTATWSINSYSIIGTISNGSLSDDTDVDYNDELNITIVPDENYTYPSSIDSVTMGGATYLGYQYSSSNGSFYIEHVTGDVEIVASCVNSSATQYEFSYDLTHCTISNAPETMYDNEIKELTIVPDEHYKLPAESGNLVSVTGAVDWSYDDDEGTITIDGAEDNLEVSVECVAKSENTISMGTLTGVSEASGNPHSVEEDASVSLTFTANSDYGLPTSSGVTVTGAKSSSWTQETGVLVITGGTSNITVFITGISKDISTITLGSKTTAYTLGDNFDMPSVTVGFNIGGSQVVTGDADLSGPVTNGVVTGSGTITISYTYEPTGTTLSSSYTITATPITPVTGGIVKVTSTSDLALNDKIVIVNETASVVMTTAVPATGTLGTASIEIEDSEITSDLPDNAAILTLSSGNSSSGWALTNGSNYLYVPNNNTRGTVLRSTSATNVISFSSGDATVKATSDATGYLQYNSGSPRFSNYTSSQATIQIYKIIDPVVKSLKWITATVKSGTYYQGNSVSDTDFTVTAYYDDATSEVVTQNITVTNNILTVVGKNIVTISYGGKSCTADVIAVEQTATLIGLSWAQGELTIIDGQEIDFSTLGTITATYDTAEPATKSIESCTVSIYTKSGGDYSKVTDISDGATITSTSHGKYLGVSYTEKAVTKIAYSSAPIYVVEELNEVRSKVEVISWSKSTSIEDGDIVTFVGETDTVCATSFNSSHWINAESYTTSVSTDFYFEVGTVEVDDETYYTFHNKDGYLGNHSTGTSSNNNAYLDSEIDEDDYKNYFTVEFDDGDVIITSVYDSRRSLQLRNGTPDRFAFYGQAQTAIQLYKGTRSWSPTGPNIANTDATAQKVVLEFAEEFNKVMQCDSSGETTGVAGNWSDLSETFDNWFFNGDKDLTEDQIENALALFAGGDAVDGGDTLQDMLARYQYICAKYKLTDFLANKAHRPPVPKSINFRVFASIQDAGSAIGIIAISVASLAAVGGYFFLRKKKED